MLSRVRRALFAFVLMALLLAGCNRLQEEEHGVGEHDHAERRRRHRPRAPTTRGPT